jgi:hypothetical protein
MRAVPEEARPEHRIAFFSEVLPHLPHLIRGSWKAV